MSRNEKHLAEIQEFLSLNEFLYIIEKTGRNFIRKRKMAANLKMKENPKKLWCFKIGHNFD